MNDSNMPVKITIKTFGCQMNVYDTQVAAGLLAHQGYLVAHEHENETPPEPIEITEGRKDERTKRRSDEVKRSWYNPDADIILMNTCSIREHAEDRVVSRLGMLAKAKKSRPELIVGLMGCMVEEHREKLFKKFPVLDLMVGTRNIKELPDLIRQVRSHRTQVSKIKQDGISIEYTDKIERFGPATGSSAGKNFHAWLPIMTGCNKVCTFCVVPMTRGAEVSMNAREVYREASRLVEEGVQWITLLGQNVNSYNGEGAADSSWLMADSKKSMSHQQSVMINFPSLLEQLCQIEGLGRISFTTSHPHDATEELFQVIARNSKISRRFHLPLQSGSDFILKRMKRLHTFAEYKQKIDRLRELVPDISITTDIISGFSGEREEDHAATINALKEIRFDGAYIYKYSLRPGTPAAKLPDDVPLAVKEKRNAELLQIQRQVNREQNETWVGKTATVFFEMDQLEKRGQIIGRTDQEKRVAIQGPKKLVGSFGRVKIDSLHNETLLASLVSSQ